MKDDFNDNVFSQYKNVDFLTCATETNSCLRSCCLCVENRCPICHHQRKLRLFLLLKICTLISSNIILPFSFCLNLLTYYMSNSKTVCNMYSSAHPAGSYTSVLKLIEHAANPITIPFQHDVITYLDNNQVLARNWKVRYDTKAILSYVTTVVHFFPSPTTDLL